MDDAQQAAVEALTAQMFAGSIAEGEVVVNDPPAPVAAATPQTPEATPAAPDAVTEAPVAPEEAPNYTFKPTLSEDLQALLDEPDFEAEAAAEVAAEQESDDYEYADPETAAKLRAADKRIAFLESQVVAKSKKGWVEEAKRAYPDLARLIPGELEGITSTSRRAFAREADRINAKYAAVLAEPLAKLEAARAAISAGAVAVAREEVATAWGKPAGDTLPPMAAAQADALQKARATGKLEESIKVLMNNTQVL